MSGGRERRQGARIASTSSFWHTLHTDRVPQGAPLTAPEKRRVHVASPGEFRDAPHTDRDPLGAPLSVPESKFAWRPSAHIGHPSHGTCPIESSTYGTTGRIRTALPPNSFDSLLKRIVSHRELIRQPQAFVASGCLLGASRAPLVASGRLWGPRGPRGTRARAATGSRRSARGGGESVERSGDLLGAPRRPP